LFPIKPAGLYGKSRIPDLQDLKRLTISRAGAHFTLPDIMRLRFLGSAAMRRPKGCWRKQTTGLMKQTLNPAMERFQSCSM
jgi:hypothetical protein